MAYNQNKGGKKKRANYQTKVIRIPLPIVKEVEKLIARFHQENDEYKNLPIVGDWWKILGVSPKANLIDIKMAYKRLVLLYHPDKNLRLDAQERMVALNKAYDEALKLHKQ